MKQVPTGRPPLSLAGLSCRRSRSARCTAHCITRRKADRPALCKSGGAMRADHGLTPIRGLALVCRLTDVSAKRKR